MVEVAKKVGKVAVVLLALAGCSGSGQQSSSGSKQNQTSTYADSLWRVFAKALDDKNTSYLAQNSLDTLQCTECGPDSSGNNHRYPNAVVLNSYLNELKHLPSLNGIPFSAYHDGNTIRIVYTIQSKNAEEGAYNLLFTLVNTAKGWKLEGMLLT